MLLWCVAPVSAACSPSSSHWLPVWCPFLCKLWLWKAAKVHVCPSTAGPCRCLVWDFCRPFNGSGHYNGHNVLHRVRQNTCQGWSRLITAPVKVGGPLVTQCRTLILSFIPCFFFGREISLMCLFNGPCKYSSISALVVSWGNSLNVRECVFVCVLVFYVRPQDRFNDGWSCQPCPTQQGPSDMLVHWTFWRECEDAGMQISYPPR